MSLILKGIDLPSKKLMEMFESDNHICIGGNYYPLMIKDVIQIPKDHGRLIDGDKIMNDLEEWKQNPNNDDEAVVFVNHFQGIIRTEPTILEAESQCNRCKHKGDEYWCRDAYGDDEGKCSIYEPYGGMRCY